MVIGSDKDVRLDRLILIFILLALQTKDMSAFEILGYIHNNFGRFYSPGSVYSSLGLLIEKNYVMFSLDEGGTRIYKMTEEGSILLKKYILEVKKMLKLYQKSALESI